MTIGVIIYLLVGVAVVVYGMDDGQYHPDSEKFFMVIGYPVIIPLLFIVVILIGLVALASGNFFTPKSK